MITLEPVQSSFIKSRGYNEGRRVLAVEFTDGTIIHYAAVPLGMWERFRDAPSPGGFFHKHIKGQFNGTKQAPPKEARVESARDKATRLLLDFRRRLLLDAGVKHGDIEDETGEARAVVDALIEAAREPDSEYVRSLAERQQEKERRRQLERDPRI